MIGPVVLDTSVWINILATEEAGRIIHAVSASCLVPIQVAKEVVRDPVSGRLYAATTHPFGRLPVVVTTLDPEESEIFLDLVSGRSVGRLGDGEAAAIAVAAVRHATLALDEKKARRIARELFPDTVLTSSVELLAGAAVKQALGDARASECLLRAQQFGGMHPVEP